MPAPAQQKSVKIGFVSTFSGPTAVIGNDMRNSFELALDHLGRKMGGLPVEVIYENDEQRPDVGRQKTEKLIQSDRVNFVVGYIWSNVLLASLKPVVDSQTFLISANAGPSQIAGELCSPFFFSTSWQNDQTPQAMGHYMNQKGVKTRLPDRPELRRRQGHAHRRALDLQGQGRRRGSDPVAGSARFLDRAVEGARGQAGRGVRVLSGRRRRAVPQSVCAVGTARPDPALHRVHDRLARRCRCRRISRSACPAPSSGSTTCRTTPTRNSSPTSAPSTRAYPSFYGAQSYDAANLVNSAVVAVKGDLDNKDGMRNEMRKANYASVRGPYRYGNNHFPIQNFYLQDVVKDAEGNLTLKTVATIVKNSQDRFHHECPMKW